MGLYRNAGSAGPSLSHRLHGRGQGGVRWPALFVLCAGCDFATVHQVERESCENRVDDDRDGKTDCADPDCFGFPTCCVDECEPGLALCDPAAGSGQAGVRACEMNPATGCTVVGAPVMCGIGSVC